MRNSIYRWIQRLRTPLAKGVAASALDRQGALDVLGRKLTASNELLSETSTLTEADFALVGKFIQIYCYSDFNARRILDTVRFALTGIESEFASKLNETDVILHLGKASASWLGPEHIGDGIRRAASTLEMHRILRHSFAHWAMRRTKDGDGFLMLTMNSSEVEKRGHKKGELGEATWAVVIRTHLVEEMENLNGHGEYLAELAAYLHEHREELRALHQCGAT